MKIDPEKVNAALIWPLPVQSVFCALPASTAISHQRYSQVAAPDFPLILIIPDTQLQFVFEVDTSDMGRATE